MRALVFISLILLWFVPFAVLGMFVWPLQGEVIGLGMGLICLFLVVLLSDKLMIFFTNPRRLGEKEKMMDYVKNLSFRLGLEDVGIYSSSRFSGNIYVLDNIFSRPKIIIGEGLLQMLSHGELQVLVYYALFRVKSGEAIFRSLANFLLIIIFLPILFFGKENSSKGLFSTLRFFFLSPFYLAKVFLFRREKNLREEDHKFLQESGLRAPFASAIFKIGQVESFNRDNLLSCFFQNLALADHQEEELFQNFFDFEYGPSARYKTLVKES
ncbi:MAG: hypothetical protein DRQ88_02525 [Epsilonproteobacteria bacterium]|nr:MAG: hypothetical protein DRQ89_02330 [Campylobacterota bacterium]RLA67543.1 MAG: hypothetical protein DRQ88_02525 [Campylobacterota bacterium]